METIATTAGTILTTMFETLQIIGIYILGIIFVALCLVAVDRVCDRNDD